MKNKCVVKGCAQRGTWTVWLYHAYCNQHQALGQSRWGRFSSWQWRWIPGLGKAHEGRKVGKPVRARRLARRLKEGTMGSIKNPGVFIMRYDVPFNFDMGWEDFDLQYHDPEFRRHFPDLLPDTDPCQMSDEDKAAFNAQRDAWVRQYHAWCEAPDGV